MCIHINSASSAFSNGGRGTTHTILEHATHHTQYVCFSYIHSYFYSTKKFFNLTKIQKNLIFPHFQLPLKWADLCIYKNKYNFWQFFVHLKLQATFSLVILCRLYFISNTTHFQRVLKTEYNWRERTVKISKTCSISKMAVQQVLWMNCVSSGEWNRRTSALCFAFLCIHYSMMSLYTLLLWRPHAVTMLRYYHVNVHSVQTNSILEYSLGEFIWIFIIENIHWNYCWNKILRKCFRTKFYSMISKYSFSFHMITHIGWTDSFVCHKIPHS